MKKEKIFLKTKNDGIWENNPTKAFALYVALVCILMFVIMFLFPFIFPKFIPEIIQIFIFLFLFVGECAIFGVLLPIKRNNECNISKSIAFIKRNNKWYAIKMMYVTSLGYWYGSMDDPSSVLALKHNLKVASSVQNAEERIRHARLIPENFSNILTNVLEMIESDSVKKYGGIKVGKKIRGSEAEADKKIDYFLNKYYFNEISLKKDGKYIGACGYLILNNLKVVNVNKRYFTISFVDENNETKIMRFRNAYAGLIEEINRK